MPTTSGTPALLDHVVIASPDLATAVDRIEHLTGVRAAPGGSHPTGTTNHLAALTVGGRPTGGYLEIVGPTRGTDPATVATFDIDRHTADAPRVAAWAIHPDSLEAAVAAARDAGLDIGDIQPLSRQTPAGELLEWRLTRHSDRVATGPVPFLIDWGATQHPSAAALPPLEIVSLTATARDPEALRRALQVLGTDLTITSGDADRLHLTVRTTEGDDVEL